jgi:2-dehydro-3-deoxyphosphogluconate aldolase/(4S)-4-hydroxy-2-oxoglutarate aldolase
MTPSTLDRVSAARIVPVVTIEQGAHAHGLGSALIAGGLPLAEITFRTAAAADAIRVLRDNYPDILVGAGTVLDPETVDLAVEAGATFIVAPGFNPRMVDHCLQRGVPVIPGVCTPWVAACGGTWLAPSADMADGRFRDITANVREAVALARTANPIPSED